MFAGDIATIMFLAKMKLWTKGRYMSADRFVTSTLCGQILEYSRFLCIGLWGMITESRTDKKALMSRAL